jgi:hypothetical protein
MFDWPAPYVASSSRDPLRQYFADSSKGDVTTTTSLERSIVLEMSASMLEHGEAEAESRTLVAVALRICKLGTKVLEPVPLQIVLAAVVRIERGPSDIRPGADLLTSTTMDVFTEVLPVRTLIGSRKGRTRQPWGQFLMVRNRLIYPRCESSRARGAPRKVRPS